MHFRFQKGPPPELSPIVAAPENEALSIELEKFTFPSPPPGQDFSEADCKFFHMAGSQDGSVDHRDLPKTPTVLRSRRLSAMCMVSLQGQTTVDVGGRNSQHESLVRRLKVHDKILNAGAGGVRSAVS